ncbi:MAG: hypothetical protein LBG59_04155 [Candidatus Peribacteria bacterium]|jgi:hypothetical protein|nr:hypothetical protein [Candidatus Peribacteria bacterium]
MKTFLKSLWISGLIIPLRGIGNISCFTQAASSVPAEYYPNYKINNDLEKIQGYFVQLEAAQKMGGSVSSELFRQLNTHFKIVFPSFPQDHTFKVIYEQCIQLSNALAENYSTTLFQGFMNNCYKQLSQTITKINSKYTIQVSATRNP